MLDKALAKALLVEVVRSHPDGWEYRPPQESSTFQRAHTGYYGNKIEPDNGSLCYVRIYNTGLVALLYTPASEREKAHSSSINVGLEFDSLDSLVDEIKQFIDTAAYRSFCDVLLKVKEAKPVEPVGQPELPPTQLHTGWWRRWTNS